MVRRMMRQQWFPTALVAMMVWLMAASAVGAPTALADDGSSIGLSDATGLADAMLVDPASLVSAQFLTQPPSGVPHLASGPLSFFPTAGPAFAILTTGDAALADQPNDDEGAGTDIQGEAIAGRGLRRLTSQSSRLR